MELSDTTKAAVALLLRWMYTGKLHDREDKLPSCCDLIEFWMLADKLLIPEAQNLAAKRIRNENIVPTSYLARVYKNTVPSSPLRKLLIDQTTSMLRFSAFENQVHGRPGKYTREILADLAIAIMKRIPDNIQAMDIDTSLYMVLVPGEEAKIT